MPEFPALGGGWSQQYGSVAATSTGTLLVANVLTDTKGVIVQLVAATEQDGHWLAITVATGSVVGLTGLVDIYIGAAAAEQVLIANLPVTDRAASEGGGGQYLFPIFIPKGSRLSAAYQSSTTLASVIVVIHQFGGSPNGPLAGCTYVDRYGATTTSRGTNIDPGGSANTYSAWAAIANTTLRPIRWLVVAFQNVDTNFAAAVQWTVQVGIGAATEQQIGGDFLMGDGTDADNSMCYMHFYLPMFIPAGSIISVRAKCSSTTDGDRDLYVSLFGCG